MKTLILLSTIILFASKALSQSTGDSAKALYTFTYNLVSKNDSSQINKKTALSQNDSTVISGKLIDERTNEAIMFAKLIFAPKKAPMYLAATPNENGEFRLVIPKHLLSRKIKIKVQALEYDTKIVTFKKKQLPLPFQIIALVRNVKLLY